MNIIIVGCGKVGSTLAKQLSKEGHDISIIDINDKVAEEFSNSHDVMGIVGNGAAYSIQKSAGIEKAHLLIAVTGSDELNLLCCLIARKAGNCETIAKVRNPIYYKEIGFIKEELGLSMVINPDYEAASEIARILRFPSAIDINVFNKGSVELLSFKLEKGSILHDMKVQEIRAKLKFDILVSNPPYIPLTEDVDPLVKDNEPHLALFGGEDGLKFYRQILKDAHQVVNEKNIIAFEHAYNHKEAMAELVMQHFPNAKFETIKDLNGKDRMTIIINN